MARVLRVKPMNALAIITALVGFGGVGLLLLAGCALPTYQEMADADCRSYGAVPGTGVYVGCMATRVAALEAGDQAAVAAMVQMNATNALIAAQPRY